MTAYLSLIRSTLEYSSIVWDPHLQKDIDKLVKVQRQAARFILGDNSSREHLCVTRMLREQHLLLQERRKANKLVFFFEVVEELVPATQCHDCLTPVQGKRQIKSKQNTDCVTINIVDRPSSNNSRF